MRLTMNPGVSAASTVVLRHPSMRLRAARVTAGSVVIAGTISTSGITGAGLKKCMPTTRPACAHAAPMAATERDDVLVANTVSGRVTRSSELNSACFDGRSSMIASITRSQRANAASWASPPPGMEMMRAIAASASARVRRCFSTSLANARSIRARARSIAAGIGSAMITSCPCTAARWAMPAPMAPAPATPMTAAGPSMLTAPRRSVSAFRGTPSRPRRSPASCPLRASSAPRTRADPRGRRPSND